MTKLGLGLTTLAMLLPLAAFADTQSPVATPTAQPQAPVEMVLLPRQLAEMAAQWVATPNAGNAVQLYSALIACIGANPSKGVAVNSAKNQCEAVSSEITNREKAMSDLENQVKELEAKVNNLPAKTPEKK